MNLRLNGRVAIVTGGSAGIGLAIAKVLAEEGVNVVIAARRAALLEAAANNIERETGKAVLAVGADTTVQEHVDQMVRTVVDKHSRVEILVNCAANPTGLPRNEIQYLDDAALLADLNTKVVGYARCAKAVVPTMLKQRWGRIINIGGLTGRASNTLTGLRNAAVCHLTKTLSDQLGPDGITVNAIHPGVVRSEHIRELFQTEARKRNTTPDVIEAEFTGTTPIRRIIEPHEIGYMVAFLASDLASAVTGESLAVDGGITRGIYL
jgi:NAD(P)-dependent dehydrogenase (short-subunit alcohol dehydrogenase family)